MPEEFQIHLRQFHNQQHVKIGASLSLFIATIYFEEDIPARCWIAPEIPQAIYREGETVLPVCPTCSRCGLHPASTTALEAPTAAPRLSASSSTR